ncbi:MULTISPECIES: IclR family transcriptional regulator [Bordetella]|uniref:IclR family transcriptional regulator n=1 Tax=Bordetella genomosp. 6 TaxID=463024 RepID=A0ABX4FFD0_9BORD|nr:MULTISPECIES: IclR family transcriptional regulator [Bordetella]AOB28267.1 IclR family transcriptional regulator [Bordetella bronchiseptica]AZW45608.1 IclR family transcriptional regulator [Bordetella bronchiseptica]KCV59639.1 transcriptional regulator, IclR family, C-terminal domain protein [Bordetella bronchiseptica 99-R-0433]OZI80880.1 IclR family transcriptional regulator [Bordetella genomosp. 6]
MRRSIVNSELGVRSPTEEELEDPLFVQAAARTLQVLSAFHRAVRPMSLDEIAEASGVGRSSTQRILNTLRVLGYVERSDGGRGYVPGIRILDHALDYLRLNTLISRASPVLLDLRRNALERVDLSVFDDLRLVYASRLQSKRETFFATLVGHSVPTFCTAGGRAILSHLPGAEVDDIIARSDRTPFTDKTITAPREIRRKVEQARVSGYAVTIEEVLVGEIGIGVAVLGADGRPVGAIHIAGSLSEWTPEAFTARFAPLAVEAATAINRLS